MRRNALLSIYFYFTHVLLLAILYVLAAELGMSLALAGDPLVWVPSSVALCALILFGYRLWPGIALGAALASLMNDDPLVVAFASAFGFIVAAAAGVYLLRRLVGFRPALERRRDVLSLIFFAAILSPVLSAAACAAGVCLSGEAAWSLFLSIGGRSWPAHSLGILLVTPLLLTWIKGSRIQVSTMRIFEALALSFLLIPSGIIAQSGLFPKDLSMTLIALSFPPLVWAALRFGPRGAATAAFFASGMPVLAVASGIGPMYSESGLISMISLSIFASAAGLTALLTAARISEDARLLRERDKQQERIKRTLSNVLGGRLNICAKCKKIRDGEERWVPIEKYVGSRTSARFTHGICPECSEALYPELCEHT